MASFSMMVQLIQSLNPSESPTFSDNDFYPSQPEIDHTIQKLLGSAPAMASACMRKYMG